MNKSQQILNPEKKQKQRSKQYSEVNLTISQYQSNRIYNYKNANRKTCQKPIINHFESIQTYIQLQLTESNELDIKMNKC